MSPVDASVHVDHYIVDDTTQILFEDGWKAIKDMDDPRKSHPRVMSHTSSFMCVIDKRAPNYSGDVYTVTYEIEGQQRSVRVTANCRFMSSNGNWIRAKDLSTLDDLMWMSVPNMTWDDIAAAGYIETLGYTGSLCDVVNVTVETVTNIQVHHIRVEVAHSFIIDGGLIIKD